MTVGHGETRGNGEDRGSGGLSHECGDVGPTHVRSLVLDRCSRRRRHDPELTGGATTRHMPLDAPILVDDALIARLRARIEAGARDN
jgi:hypothetical protein